MKHLSIKNFLIFSIFAAFTIVGCEDDDDRIMPSKTETIRTSESNLEKNNRFQNKSTPNYFNSDNPWDSVGIYHNIKLDEYIANYTGNGTTLNYSDCHFVSEGLDDLDNLNNSGNDVDSAINIIIDDLETNLSSTLSLEDALKNATTSDRAEFFATEIANLFTESERSTKSFDQHITDLKNLEDDIMAETTANQDLTAVDEMYLLMACSVGRHSSGYWNNVLNTPNNDWEDFDWYGNPGNGNSAGLSWYAKDLEQFAYSAMSVGIVGVVSIAVTGGVSAGPMLLGMGVSSAIASAR